MSDAIADVLDARLRRGRWRRRTGLSTALAALALPNATPAPADSSGATDGATLTLEHRPVPRLVLKLEGRSDRSSANVFATPSVDAEGQPLLVRSQLLVLLGVVASF